MAGAELSRALPTAATGARAESASQWVGKRNVWLDRLAGYLGMTFCVLLIGIPVYWMLIGAVKHMDEIYRVPPTWIPLRPTLSNFPRAWRSAPPRPTCAGSR